ncbi:MAG: DNA repair protein RecO [Chloroflexi bacterium OLB15]|nr:MAG: DNA repair protein RecO [Chloroflexi bacterium OLB15]
MARAEHSFRTAAIILKRRDFGEADRLLTILTPEHGKQDVIAKGARKLTSQKMGHVELFTCAEMLVHTGRELGVVAQAEMTIPFNALRENLTRGAYAAYCAELVDRFTSPGEDDTTRLFNLTRATLERVDQETDPRLAVRYFEVHLLDVSGFRPELHFCAAGGEPLLPQDQVFSYSEGGVICPQHAPAYAGTTVPLPMQTLKLLRMLQRSRYEAIRETGFPTGLLDDAERLMNGYLTYLLERRLQSVDFLRRLRREGATTAPNPQPPNSPSQ